VSRNLHLTRRLSKLPPAMLVPISRGGLRLDRDNCTTPPPALPYSAENGPRSTSMRAASISGNATADPGRRASWRDAVDIQAHATNDRNWRACRNPRIDSCSSCAKFCARACEHSPEHARIVFGHAGASLVARGARMSTTC
jgi:hypothetical protein